MAEKEKEVVALEIAERWVTETFPMTIHGSGGYPSREGPFWKDAEDAKGREEALLERADLVHRVAKKLVGRRVNQREE